MDEGYCLGCESLIEPHDASRAYCDACVAQNAQESVRRDSSSSSSRERLGFGPLSILSSSENGTTSSYESSEFGYETMPTTEFNDSEEEEQDECINDLTLYAKFRPSPRLRPVRNTPQNRRQSAGNSNLIPPTCFSPIALLPKSIEKRTPDKSGPSTLVPASLPVFSPTDPSKTASASQRDRTHSEDARLPPSPTRTAATLSSVSKRRTGFQMRPALHSTVSAPASKNHRGGKGNFFFLSGEEDDGSDADSENDGMSYISQNAIGSRIRRVDSGQKTPTNTQIRSILSITDLTLDCGKRLNASPQLEQRQSSDSEADGAPRGRSRVSRRVQLGKGRA